MSEAQEARSITIRYRPRDPVTYPRVDQLVAQWRAEADRHMREANKLTGGHRFDGRELPLALYSCASSLEKALAADAADVVSPPT